MSLDMGFQTGELEAEKKAILGDSEPELIARKDAKEKVDIIQNAVEDIEILKDNYSKIQLPTNEQWIELQSEVLSKYSGILEIEKEILRDTNEQLESHNKYNQIHLDVQQMTDEATQTHKDEITSNNEQINKNNDKIQEKTAKQADIADKIAFYEKLKAIPDLEKVKNIEDVSETLYSFFETSLGSNVGMDILTELNVDNIDLFSAYAKTYVTEILDHGKVDENNFKKIYLLMQNTYEDYRDRYGDIEVNRFAQFFTGSFNALDRYGDVAKDGFFDVIGALREESDLNRSLYEVENNVDEPFWNNLKYCINDWFNGQRKEEYRDILGEIKAIATETEKNQPKIQTGGEIE